MDHDGDDNGSGDDDDVDEQLSSGNETSVVEPSPVGEGAVSEVTPVVYQILHEDDDNNDKKGSTTITGPMCSCEFCYSAILFSVYWFVMWAVLILLATDSTR